MVGIADYTEPFMQTDTFRVDEPCCVCMSRHFRVCNGMIHFVFTRLFPDVDSWRHSSLFTGPSRFRADTTQERGRRVSLRVFLFGLGLLYTMQRFPPVSRLVT